MWPFPHRLLFSQMLAWWCILAAWVWALTWPPHLKGHSPNLCFIFFTVLHPLTWMLLYLLFAFSTGRWAPWGHHCLSGPEWSWALSDCLLNNCWVTEEGTSSVPSTSRESNPAPVSLWLFVLLSSPFSVYCQEEKQTSLLSFLSIPLKASAYPTDCFFTFHWINWEPGN